MAKVTDKLEGNEKTLTISDKVYRYLKESIIKNRIKPNQRIDEKEIAALFDSSTTPVREAILRLSAEGFIKLSRYRHSTVREISSEELQQMYEVMTILDNQALRSVIAVMKDEDLQKIRELTDELGKYCDVNSLEKYLEVNALIHTTIWKVIKNKFFYSTLIQVYDQIQRYAYARYSVFTREGALKRSLKKHMKLLEVLTTRDISNLKRLVREHWKV